MEYTFENVKAYIDNVLTLIPEVGGFLSSAEAEQRAGVILKAQSWISHWRYILMQEKIIAETTKSAVYGKLLSGLSGSKITVTEKNAQIEADPEFTKAREKLDDLEARIKYASSIFDIFGNGHLILRQMGKGDTK